MMSLSCVAALCAESPVFKERGGMVVIEAESTESALDKWVIKKDVKGYKGSGHLEFTGNKPESGPAVSPLRYSFKINKSGNYKLIIRAHKNLISDRQDICNDCYVRIEGDYTSGNKTPLDVLKKDAKMFGGSASSWAFATKLDVNHKKYDPIYTFKKGETYTIIISGRSKNFNMDRFLLLHDSKRIKEVQDRSPSESKKL